MTFDEFCALVDACSLRDPNNIPRDAAVEAFKQARDATMALLDATNTMGSDCQKAIQAGVIEGMMRTHKHLQSQGTFALLEALGIFGGFTEAEARTDARNEASHRACKLLRESHRDFVYWKDA